VAKWLLKKKQVNQKCLHPKPPVRGPPLVAGGVPAGDAVGMGASPGQSQASKNLLQRPCLPMIPRQFSNWLTNAVPALNPNRQTLKPLRPRRNHRLRLPFCPMLPQPRPPRRPRFTKPSKRSMPSSILSVARSMTWRRSLKCWNSLSVRRTPMSAKSNLFGVPCGKSIAPAMAATLGEAAFRRRLEVPQLAGRAPVSYV
jgi:hypothetical protein